MPFTSHLAELRNRLVKSVLAVAVAFFACYAFVDDIFALLAAPLRRLSIRGLTLIGTAVTEAFFTKMKISFIAAVILASPVLLWQAWQFVAPGLYQHEKRYSRSFVLFGSFFFIGGVAFCYGIVIQHGLNFLLQRYEAINIQPLLQVGDYLSLVSRLTLAFGIMFELPVLSFFLARVGLIDHHFLLRHYRYAIIVIALFAAVLTPPDFISQVLFMIPLSLLYLISIAVAYAARFRMNRREKAVK
ncbi:MAG: Sec-independent protein translocase protein TatC [Deltaproteobacteria bacterium]|nr:Sec-independent protein translocase protein TatC [Deltaproteobacteria bacterium]